MKKVKVDDILKSGHSLMNDVVMSTAGEMKDAHFVIKLDDALKNRGITQKDLAQMTGMRVGTISEIVNGKGISLNKVQFFAIMVALRITDLSELIEIKFPEDLELEYKEQRDDWEESKHMPIEVRDMYKENLLKANLK